MAKRVPNERSDLAATAIRELAAAAAIAGRSKRKPPPTPLTPREREMLAVIVPDTPYRDELLAGIVADTPHRDELLAKLLAEFHEFMGRPATPPLTAEEETMQRDIDRIAARLDAEIPEAQKAMDALLSRLRATRFPVAA